MALKINVALDRRSAELVALGRAVALMADVHLPKATARSVLEMARATRHALEAGEYDYAVDILAELYRRLEDEDTASSNLVKAKASALVVDINKWQRVSS